MIAIRLYGYGYQLTLLQVLISISDRLCRGLRTCTRCTYLVLYTVFENALRNNNVSIAVNCYTLNEQKYLPRRDRV